MRNKYYILKGKDPVPCDLMDGAVWLEGAKESRIVKQEMVGDSKISTVFLGLDHSFGEGPPLLFETLIFGGPLDGWMWRCSTREQAEEQHRKAVENLQGEKEEDPR